jgi:CRISPR-associated protein Cas1
MRPLLLSGFGINIGVNKRKLVIYKRQNNEIIEFFPHRISYDNIIVDGHYGAISFEAMRWLSKHGITLSLLNWNGNLLSVTTPKDPISGKLKIKQYKSYITGTKRCKIAYEIINFKIEKLKELLLMLTNFYKELNRDEILRIFNNELKNFAQNNVIEYENKTNKLEKLKEDSQRIENNRIRVENKQNETEIYRIKIIEKSIKNNVIHTEIAENSKSYLKNLMAYEGRIADYYWRALSKVFNKLYPEFNFKQRKNLSYSQGMNASDYVNALLNYGYAILESVIRRDINIIGLDQNIGFLHEINDSKTPLVYDLQELYRWLIDLSIIQILEDKKIKKSDFIVTENYHLRLREQGIRYLLEKITLNLNKRAEYGGKFCTFDNILLDNVRKLGNFIEKDQKELKFDIPDIQISRNDNAELRNQIMRITPEIRKKLKINKSTLWYQQKAIKGERTIKIYKSRNAAL